jgi:hypothetical protein
MSRIADFEIGTLDEVNASAPNVDSAVGVTAWHEQFLAGVDLPRKAIARSRRRQSGTS